ncbi:CPBP family intramembrane glutamic endopeptidase [Bacillus pseudomycoides]|uniref:CPBP family intramembrane glutamic endopeptidase n=1 Tax=Bacillus pseudomycoides TaxID=64104 RepID=UPI0028D82A20|nr:CPBP family intramembrane glutamic endopeptidase [Bacillus pseudomycoides]
MFRNQVFFFTGLIISSLLFGLAHDYDFAFIIFATLTSIIDGLLYKKTNSIIPGLIGHITYNLYNRTERNDALFKIIFCKIISARILYNNRTIIT